jgi:hypothetical protein
VTVHTRALASLAALLLLASSAIADEIWLVDQLVADRRPGLEIIGTPKTTSVDGRHAVVFDGKQDGLLVNANPVAGSPTLTIELLVYPASNGNKEQRFFHLQDVAGRRALLETRTDDRGNWWLDGFMRTSSDPNDKGLPLIDPKLTHPVEHWYWVGLRYDGRQLATFVDGVKQSEGTGNFGAIEAGKISLGVRQNLVYWFKGAIAEVRFHSRALTDEELQRATP